MESPPSPFFATPLIGCLIVFPCYWTVKFTDVAAESPPLDAVTSKR
jgi:hypothetical protein